MAPPNLIDKKRAKAASRGCKREIALEALLDGKDIGRESRVVRM